MVAMPERVDTGVMQRTTPQEWTSGWPQSPAEFADLIDMFQDRLVRYAFCRLKDVSEAEDVVQDVFVKAFANRHELREVRAVAPYLYRMVGNLCIDRLRRPRPVMVTIDEAALEQMADDRPPVTDRIAAAERLRRTEELIAKLPRRQAEVLRLRVLEDMSLAEIAEIHGCPVATIKSRLRYGVGRLQAILSRNKERAL